MDGAAELADATSGLDTKVIDTIKDKLEEYLNPAFTPTDFVTESTTNGIDRVQFVYMTGAIEDQRFLVRSVVNLAGQPQIRIRRAASGRPLSFRRYTGGTFKRLDFQMVVIVIIVVVVVVLACIVAGIYNNMVTLRNRIDNAWQNIDTQLQRRNDLIPNLVETVKGYATHEKGALEAVVNARNAALSAQTPDEKMAADNVLTGALRQLFAVAEAYPDLKANANFTQLQDTLEDTENKVSYARQSYNDCVLNYNNAIQTFPGNIFAGIFQFRERQGFEAAEASRQVPQVKF